jgi:hypothetical protein
VCPVASSIRLPPGAEPRVVRGCGGKTDITLFLVDGVVAALGVGISVAGRGAQGLCLSRVLATSSRCSVTRTACQLSCRPGSQLVKAREAWAAELGTLDAVTCSTTRGQLVMPCRVSAVSSQTRPSSGLHAVFWPKWQAATLESGNETVNQDSALILVTATSARGLRALLTTASIQVTSSGWPGP